jgi:hypothetical protein
VKGRVRVALCCSTVDGYWKIEELNPRTRVRNWANLFCCCPSLRGVHFRASSPARSPLPRCILHSSPPLALALLFLDERGRMFHRQGQNLPRLTSYYHAPHERLLKQRRGRLAAPDSCGWATPPINHHRLRLCLSILSCVKFPAHRARVPCRGAR